MTDGKAVERIDIVADYGHVGDMAFAEVEQRLDHLLDGKMNIRVHAVTPFDTASTGFYLAQLALNSKLGTRQLFYVNTAPRKDDPSARVNNDGEGLAYAKLVNGVEIVAVNSGYSLSFIKPAAEKIAAIDIATAGSQFRSRDIFPEAVAQIANRNYDMVNGDIMDTIPDVPKNVLGYVDGYGNMKFTTPVEDILPYMGQEVRVSINNITRKVFVSEGIFGVPDGELCFSSGSSGWTLPDGTKMAFTEIVLRGGSAASLFNNPTGGETLHWETAEDAVKEPLTAKKSQAHLKVVNQ